MGFIDNIKNGIANTFKSIAGEGYKEEVKKEYDAKFDNVLKTLKQDDTFYDENKWRVISSSILGTQIKPQSNLYLKQYFEWVYANVHAIAEAVSNIEIKLFKYNAKKDEVDEIKAHELLEILNKVNPYMTKGDFFFNLQANLSLTGEAPIRLKRKNPKNLKELPSELWPLNPANVEVMVGKDKNNYEMVIEYQYMIDGVIGNTIKLNPWEVVFIKNLNPLNFWRGVGTVEASSRSIDILNYSETYNLNFFKNSAVPYSVLYTDQKLTEETLERLRNMWNSNYTGFNNAFKTAVLEQGLKLEKLQQTARDMDFLAQQKFLRDKLMAMFGTSPVILGITENVNKAVAEASEYVFMKYCVKPKMQKICEYLNEFLVPLYDQKGELFLDFVDPVIEDRTNKIQEYSVAVDKWMTKNEIRDEEGLPPLDGGDEIWQPMGLTTMGTPITMEEIKPEEQSNEEISNEEIDEEQPEEEIMQEEEVIAEEEQKRIKYRILRPEYKISRRRKLADKHRKNISNLLNRNVKIKKLTEEFEKQLKKMISKRIMKKPVKQEEEKKYIGIFEKGFNSKTNIEKFQRSQIQNYDKFEDKIFIGLNLIYEDQQKEIISKLKRKGTKFIITRNIKSIEKAVGDDYMFNINNNIKKTDELLARILLKAIESQGGEAANLLDIEGFEYDLGEAARQYLKKKPLQASKTMTKTIYQRVRNQLAIGIKKEETINELVDRIKSVYSKLDEFKAEVVARTEVSRATNFATLDCYRQSGVVSAKRWITALDERVCEFCAPLDGKVVEIDEDFFGKGDSYISPENGNVLNLDYENVEAPPLHVNCRCSLAPVLISTKNIKPLKNKENKEDDEDKKSTTEDKANKLLEEIEKELYDGQGKVETIEEKDTGRSS